MNKRISKIICFSFISIFVTVSCSSGFSMFGGSSSSTESSTSSSGGVYKIGNPYQVGGVWYYPREDYNYSEEGVASWYGPDFHNGTTANGETYDMYALTAAHRTLPLPSIVKVTNLENGRSLILRVNDRGPFVNNRIIDVSKKAAQLLDFHTQGTTRVRVDIMPEESRAIKAALLYDSSTEINVGDNYGSFANEGEAVEDLLIPTEYTNSSGIRSVTKPPSNIFREEKAIKSSNKKDTSSSSNKQVKEPIVIETLSEGGFYIQTGAFSSKSNAEKMAMDLKQYGDSKISPLKGDNRTLYRVRLGPFKDTKVALEKLDKLKSLGYNDARIVEDKVIKEVTTKAIKVDIEAGTRLDKEF